MSEHYNDVLASNKAHVLRLFNGRDKISYEQKCMLVTALYQCVEAKHALNVGIEYGSDLSYEDVMKYVRAIHSSVKEEVAALICTISMIKSGCYRASCIESVDEFVASSGLSKLISEFGILSSIPLSDAVRVSGEYIHDKSFNDVVIPSVMGSADAASIMSGD